MRVVKPYQVHRAKPATLIVGNSRPEMGLDPLFFCWPVAMKPIYSMTLPGSNVYMQVRYVQHALAGNSVKTILMGLDFLDFLVKADKKFDLDRWPPTVQGFENRLLTTANGQKNHGYFMHSLKDHLTAALSLDALKDSLLTLVAQNSLNATTRTEFGFNPALDYMNIIQTEGQRVLFAQKNSEVIERLLRNDWSLYQGETKWSEHLEALKWFIDYVTVRDIQLILFINPYHADYLESIWQTGKWPLLEEWKRALVELAADYSVPLWDFNGFNRFTTDKQPAAGDKKSVLNWFWEPAHYRKELGNIMLVQMITDESCRKPKTTIGTLISPENIDQHLSLLRSQRDAYVVNNPELVFRISRIVQRKAN